MGMRMAIQSQYQSKMPERPAVRHRIESFECRGAKIEQVAQNAEQQEPVRHVITKIERTLHRTVRALTDFTLKRPSDIKNGSYSLYAVHEYGE